jgi:hypothetical protein
MQNKNMCIIGNCQAKSLSQFLLSNSEFSNKYKYVEINDIFRMDENELDSLYQNILPTLHLIIIQPISENYRNNYKYSTKSILHSVRQECIKILFPSLYFDFYHPFLSYVYDKNRPSWKLGDPFDYHDINIIKEYIDENNVEHIFHEYKRKQMDENLLDHDYFINRLNTNIENLRERENNYSSFCTNDTYIIKSSSYLLENYKKNLLFYTNNHPTKYLFYYISNKILSFLMIPLEEYPVEIDPLKALIIPLYKTIEKEVDFDIEYYFHFRHYEIILDDRDIIEKYIRSYNEMDQYDKSILRQMIF